ncbi:MAG: VPLPA-CTERM sorting domain-containing protein [Pseudomonadota bacterium]
MKLKAAALSAAALIWASAASAVTITVEADGTFATNGGVYEVETFESLATGEVGPLLGTGVGTFLSLGGTGSGGTVVGSGTELAIKNEGDGNLGGRFNTTLGGEQFLDSNDAFGVGIAFDLGGSLFDTIAFSLTDATDQGATLTIEATDGTAMSTSLSGLGNGNLQLVTIKFDTLVSFAIVTLEDDILNDGFGIDDVYVGTVPLPAAALLMLAGLGAVGALRMKRHTA